LSSTGLDHLSSGRVFGGLASCGARACFDELNRIAVEFLAIVAQQVVTVQSALAARRPSVAFGLSMDAAAARSCATTSRCSFRPDAMAVVPDYALIIGSISLSSCCSCAVAPHAGNLRARARLARARERIRSRARARTSARGPVCCARRAEGPARASRPCPRRR
jgi:hypothetical protein